MAAIVFIAKALCPDVRTLSKTTGLPHIVTIKFSHYVELARWSMQYCGINFVEHSYAPIQHILPALAARVGKTKTENIVSNSSVTNQSNSKEKRGGMTATPVLILPDGSSGLSDSWEISTWACEKAGLQTCPEGLKTLIDFEVGTYARQLVYSYILAVRNENIYEGLVTDDAHWLWRTLWWMGLRGFTFSKMREAFKTLDTEAVAACKEKLKTAVHELDTEWIMKKKGKYLTGDKISQGDIAVAALMAPLVSPELYCLGKFKKWFDLAYQQDAAYREEVEYWRGTAAGKYTLEMYATVRSRTVAV